MGQEMDQKNSKRKKEVANFLIESLDLVVVFPAFTRQIKKSPPPNIFSDYASALYPYSPKYLIVEVLMNLKKLLMYEQKNSKIIAGIGEHILL